MSIMIHPEDLPDLRSIAEDHTDFRTRRAAKVILALHETDKTKTSIAGQFGINRTTLFRIEKAYEENGVEGLIRKKTGRPPIVTEAYRRELDKALQTHPRGLGLGNELAWTAQQLVDYMEDKTGVDISVWSMRDLLRDMGYVYELHRVIIKIGGQDRRRGVKGWTEDKVLEDRYSRD